MLPFAVTIFLSATLLFLVQPMMGKMLLPLAGGSSAVWNTCMVTFQAALLGGYLYSHLVTKKLSLKHQVLVHGLLSLAAFGLAFRPAPTEPPPADSTLGLTFWLIGAIVATVGLPFFVVSTTGPLIQNWFSRTTHPRAQDPYFLYAASNIGSSLGLLGYPFLLEPNFNIPLQQLIWAGLFFILAILLVVCGVLASRSQAERELERHVETAPEPIRWQRRVLWTLLAAAPSSLMIGVTQHISTDLAAVPLLWVIPLFLYLMTFTVAFSPRIPLPATLLGWILLPLALTDGFVVMTGLTKPFLPILSLNIATFTIAALMCHRRLADDRPSTARLTEFYFFIALGGVLGGIFNALIAPVAFTLLYEYPVALATCFLLRPWRAAELPEEALGIVRLHRSWSRLMEDRFGVAVAFIAAGLALAMLYFTTLLMNNSGAKLALIEYTRAIIALTFCGVLALIIARPLISAVPFLALLIAGQYLSKISYGDEHLALRRSFFGVNHVFAVHPRKDGVVFEDAPTVHKLHHGTTLHGAQLFGTITRIRPDGSTYKADASKAATTYYHARGPVGDMMRLLADTPDRRQRFALTGNGIGELTRGGELADDATSAFPALTLGTLTAWPALAQNVADVARANSPITSVAVVGLGSGGLAASAKAGDRYTFYEIDPVVRDIATDPKLFTYVADARERGAKVDIVIGDGRIQIKKAQNGAYGLIILDAFSSDAIPVHLLTQEALKIYLDKLRPDGVVAFHISNRYFDLEPVLARHALDLRLAACSYRSLQDQPDSAPRGITRQRNDYEYMADSTWVVLSKDPAALANFAADKPWWKPIPTTVALEGPEWTDDFADILAVFRGIKN